MIRGQMIRVASGVANRTLSGTRYVRRQTAEESLLRLAEQICGPDILTEWNITEALAALAASLQNEASLSAFGHLSFRVEALRFFRTLRRMKEEEQSRPDIRERAIRRPLFITGIPRSGTTFLHNLMTLDPRNVVPRCWQTIYPFPPRGAPDRRRQKVQRQFADFLALAPELPDLHPLAADLPQECTDIMSYVFRSLRFDTTHAVRSYRRWLDLAGHEIPYRFHRRFLQHLAGAFRETNDADRTFVLKCPDHVFALGALRRVYPDALIVLVHRDPAKVMPSVAKLTEVLRAPFTTRLDRMAIGRQVTGDWLVGTECMIAAQHRLPAANLLNLTYAEIVGDPAGVMARLYAFMGRSFEPSLRARVEAFNDGRPRGGYGRNLYRAEDYGIDTGTIRARFRAYTEQFGLGFEGAG
ncbi:MAG: sulfotransferase [Acetobacteraceae bacterium]|nr:sulfotransferase [Acetobacteraceae bacterium]